MREEKLREAKIPFHPDPVLLRMVVSGPGRYVVPTLITWNGPGALSLADAAVQPGDEEGEPLPDGQPFLLKQRRHDGRSGSALLTIAEREYTVWEPAFRVHRKVILTVRFGGVRRQLEVQLRHVRIIPADFQLLLIDAGYAVFNRLSRLVHAVWYPLRVVVPPHIQEAPRVQEAPPVRPVKADENGPDSETHRYPESLTDEARAG